MDAQDARDRFAELAVRRDADIDLAEAALVIAAEEYPQLDVAAYLGRLDELARRAEPGLSQARSDAERVASLNRQLFGREGFTGNRDAYHDPRNSFLNEVLDRRLGIPITLCLVYLEVAHRLALPVHGIGFPGHFLAGLGEPTLLVVDAFHARVLTLRDCQDLLDAVSGGGLALQPELHLRPATPREILVRLLSNLKQLRLRSGDLGRSLACCERILLLTPDAPAELRDRGFLYERLECHAAARADFERFLALAPEDETAPAIRRILAGLPARPRQLH